MEKLSVKKELINSAKELVQLIEYDKSAFKLMNRLNGIETEYAHEEKIDQLKSEISKANHQIDYIKENLHKFTLQKLINVYNSKHEKKFKIEEHKYEIATCPITEPFSKPSQNILLTLTLEGLPRIRLYCKNLYKLDQGYDEILNLIFLHGLVAFTDRYEYEDGEIIFKRSENINKRI